MGREEEAIVAELSVDHLRGDRFSIRIRGHEVVADQPREHGGEDGGPTPTELFVAGLAACAGFYAGRFLRRHGIPSEGLRVECAFDMATDPPSRVSFVELRLLVPAELSETRRKALLRMVDRCTVHNSLRDAPQVRIGLETSGGPSRSGQRSAASETAPTGAGSP